MNHSRPSNPEPTSPTSSQRPGTRARSARTPTPEEAAWHSALDATPWLMDKSRPRAQVAPEDLYQTLKPFKQKVAEDIKESERAQV